MKTVNLKNFYICMLALVLSLFFIKIPDIIYASDNGEEETTSEKVTEKITYDEESSIVKESEENSISESEKMGEEPTRGYSQGVGSIGNAIITTNDLNGSLEFVPITTKEGQKFYLLIDYSQSDNNVYFLDAVTLNDLVHIAETETDADGNPIYLEISTKETETVTATEESSEKLTEAEEPKEEKEQTNSMSDRLVMLFGIVVLLAVAFVIIYFVKVKGRKIDEDEDNFGEDNDESEVDEEIFPEESEENVFSMEIKEEPKDGMKDIDNVENDEIVEFIEDDETDNSDL